MKFSEKQIRWLEKATAKDISKVFAKKDLEFADKMAIQKMWLEIHDRNRFNKEVYQSSWWGKDEDVTNK